MRQYSGGVSLSTYAELSKNLPRYFRNIAKTKDTKKKTLIGLHFCDAIGKVQSVTQFADNELSRLPFCVVAERTQDDWITFFIVCSLSPVPADRPTAGPVRSQSTPKTFSLGFHK